jgi:hypothetical protein
MPKRDGYTRSAIERQEQRERIYYRDRGRCVVCRAEHTLLSCTIAHRIMDAVWTRSKYGDDVIDADENKCVTCPGTCNDRALISYNPYECNIIVNAVRGANGNNNT